MGEFLVTLLPSEMLLLPEYCCNISCKYGDDVIQAVSVDTVSSTIVQ
jgi:hypothetical protein